MWIRIFFFRLMLEILYRVLLKLHTVWLLTEESRNKIQPGDFFFFLNLFHFERLGVLTTCLDKISFTECFFFSDNLITKQLFLNFPSHSMEEQPIPTFHFYISGEVLLWLCFFVLFFLTSDALR